MTKLSTEQEPSGQTVRYQIIRTVTDICFENGGVTKPMADKLADYVQESVVSVLEELKNDIDTVQPESDYYAEAIAAVIAKYKEGGNHER